MYTDILSMYEELLGGRRKVFPVEPEPVAALNKSLILFILTRVLLGKLNLTIWLGVALLEVCGSILNWEVETP
jgi:hypothetical protein